MNTTRRQRGVPLRRDADAVKLNLDQNPQTCIIHSAGPKNQRGFTQDDFVPPWTGLLVGTERSPREVLRPAGRIIKTKRIHP